LEIKRKLSFLRPVRAKINVVIRRKRTVYGDWSPLVLTGFLRQI
jgi:hypothetical protein